MEARVAIMSIEAVDLYFSSNKILVLNDCLFVTNIRKKLISVSSLFKYGYCILFNNEISIELNGSFICWGKLVDSIYLITSKM